MPSGLSLPSLDYELWQKVQGTGVREIVGTDNVAYFDKLGLVNRKLVLAHCVHLTAAEERIAAVEGERGMVERAHTRVSRERMYRTTGIQTMPINTVFQLLAEEDGEVLLGPGRMAADKPLLGQRRPELYAGRLAI